MSNLNIGHVTFLTIGHANLMLGMHMYLIKMHVLRGHMSRSMVSFKVKVQINYVNLLTGDIRVSQTPRSCFTLLNVFCLVSRSKS